MSCPLYDELRADLVKGCLAGFQSGRVQNRHLLQRWNQGTQAQHFDLLMAMQGKDEVKALAHYLEKAWDMRAAFLELQAAAPRALRRPSSQERNVLDVSGNLNMVASVGAMGNSSRPREGIASDSDSEVVLEP